jgi:signal transduction histidine kinase
MWVAGHALVVTRCSEISSAAGSTSWVILRRDPPKLRCAYRSVMAARHAVLRHGDLLLAVVLAAVLTTEIVRWQPHDLLPAVPAGLVATLAVGLRRKTPLVAYLLVLAGMTGVLLLARDIDRTSIALTALFLVAPYSLGRHSTGLEVWLGGLAVLTAAAMFDLYDNSIIDVSGIAFGLAVMGGPWAAGVAIKVRHEREKRLAARTRELERDQAEQAQRAVAAERARIARELHDVVSHAIAVTVLQARGARRQFETAPDEARRALDAIEQTNTAALSDMRRLLAVLRDTEGDADDDRHPQPGLTGIDSLIDHVRESGVPVTLDVVGDRSEVPPGVDLSAYRIVQEALTNVIKHAGKAASATVTLEYEPDALAVRVLDTGEGPTETDGTGHGLIGIRERAAVVGGEVTTGPGPDGGFEIRARLPFALEPA